MCHKYRHISLSVYPQAEQRARYVMHVCSRLCTQSPNPKINVKFCVFDHIFQNVRQRTFKVPIPEFCRS